MSKKSKSGEDGKLQLLGRLGTNLEVGIVGLPNVGKSTFFNVITNSSIPAENFPFCTIDPNTNRVLVPDERFDWLVEHWKPANNVPAILKITDIAGLVKGANEGQGLGNAFLSNIKAVDAIFHMVRGFKDKKVSHVEGSIDPIRDMEIIVQELILKDISFLEGRRESLVKIAQQQKEKKNELEVLEECLKLLKEGTQIRFHKWKSQDIDYLNMFQLLTAKPVVYLVNVGMKEYAKGENEYIQKIQDWVEKDSAGTEKVIMYSAQFEKKFQKAKDEEKLKIKEKGVDSKLPEIIKEGFRLLNLSVFFTAGTDEVKAWTIKKGYKAPQAAGRIHTDFEKTFVCCEVMKYEDFKEHESEAACKANGKCLQQGKNYTVEDGDIIFFKAGAARGGKKK